MPDRLAAAAPAGVGQSASTLTSTERVLASVIEAVIGACYLHAGYDRTAEAVVEAFTPEIEHALEHPVDFKSTLQERLAQRGEAVEYAVTAELGPPHDRTFEVLASVGGRPVGTGSGRSKKHAEQEAARVALEMIDAPHLDDEDDDENGNGNGTG
ncbi:MAG: ribonuclease [Solirubrobacteraceae bacterium]|nr:ribonuclease [Solirubrobacteraceae bacterium]